MLCVCICFECDVCYRARRFTFFFCKKKKNYLTFWLFPLVFACEANATTDNMSQPKWMAYARLKWAIPKVTNEKHLFGGATATACLCEFSLGDCLMMAGEKLKNKKIAKKKVRTVIPWWRSAARCIAATSTQSYRTSSLSFCCGCDFSFSLFVWFVLVFDWSSTQTNLCSWNRCWCSTMFFVSLFAEKLNCVRTVTFFILNGVLKWYVIAGGHLCVFEQHKYDVDWNHQINFIDNFLLIFRKKIYSVNFYSSQNVLNFKKWHS